MAQRRIECRVTGDQSRAHMLRAAAADRSLTSWPRRRERRITRWRHCLLSDNRSILLYVIRSSWPIYFYAHLYRAGPGNRVRARAPVYGCLSEKAISNPEEYPVSEDRRQSFASSSDDQRTSIYLCRLFRRYLTTPHCVASQTVKPSEPSEMSAISRLHTPCRLVDIVSACDIPTISGWSRMLTRSTVFILMELADVSCYSTNTRDFTTWRVIKSHSISLPS